MQAYVGTSGFSYPQWKGSFYPESIKPEAMLAHYAGRFRTVEVNNTFYRMPRDSVLARWVHETPPDFRFVLKASRRITHQDRLAGSESNVHYLFERVLTLGDKLGPVLFQPPPSLRKDVSRLRAFLKLLPPEREVAFEFRHPSWLDDEVYDLLRAHGAALCVADREAGEGPEIPLVPTATWGYLRLRRDVYSETELREWASRIRETWERAFVFFMHEDEGEAPGLALRLAELLKNT